MKNVGRLLLQRIVHTNREILINVYCTASSGFHKFRFPPPNGCVKCPEAAAHIRAYIALETFPKANCPYLKILHLVYTYVYTVHLHETLCIKYFSLTSNFKVDVQETFFGQDPIL